VYRYAVKAGIGDRDIDETVAVQITCYERERMPRAGKRDGAQSETGMSSGILRQSLRRGRGEEQGGGQGCRGLANGRIHAEMAPLDDAIALKILGDGVGSQQYEPVAQIGGQVPSPGWERVRVRGIQPHPALQPP
jgi:hypothetical protein